MKPGDEIVIERTPTWYTGNLVGQVATIVELLDEKKVPYLAYKMEKLSWPV